MQSMAKSNESGCMMCGLSIPLHTFARAYDKGSVDQFNRLMYHFTTYQVQGDTSVSTIDFKLDNMISDAERFISEA